MQTKEEQLLDSVFGKPAEPEKALEQGKAFFHDRYSLAKMYNSPSVAGPMGIWLYEQGERTNALLSEISNLLKSGEKTSTPDA